MDAKTLAVILGRIDRLEDTQNKKISILDGKISKVDEKVVKLNYWKMKVVGGSLVISILISGAFGVWKWKL